MPVTGWLGAVWHSFRSVSLVFVVPALALQTLQTVSAGVAWHGILRRSYPEGGVRFPRVLACYSTGVVLNNFLPANAGTVVGLLMFVATIGGATLVAVIAASAVEGLFFAAMGVVVAAYLLISDGGSLVVQLVVVGRHPWATGLALVGVVAIVVVLFWFTERWLRHIWQQVKDGGRILSDPRAYLRRVVAPQLLSWCCGFGIVAVLLTAYGIPVGFHTVMRVIGGNSVANLAAVTPGGIGVNQAVNVATLHGATSAATAGAYSIGQQMLKTAWNLTLAVVLLTVVFGWSGSLRLVKQSYVRARRSLQERHPWLMPQRSRS
jgi:uncharacterized membrane protein YbhN (UPF0104 family)